MKSPPAPPPTPQQKPRNPGRIRAIALAVGVHAAFFALIIFGVSWQSTPTPPVEAELWDKLPPVKTAQAPKPEPEPVKPPEPKPQPAPPKPAQVKPEPPPPKPPEVKPEPAKPDPAIALKAEREKKDMEKRERLDKEKRERVEKEKAERKKEEEARKKLAQEDAAKKKREDEQKRKEEEIARAEAERVRAAAAAAKKAEFDSFVTKIRDRIRGRANVPDTVSGNPEVEVLIRILPGGEVLDIAITKRSGNPTYDTAIERAIRSASPLPVPPANSELFPQFRELKLKIRHER